MAATANIRRAAPSHQGLLRSPVDLDAAALVVDSWFRGGSRRGEKMFTLAAPSPAGATPTALTPADLHPSAEPTGLVRRALSEGFVGLGILIWADQVITATSAEYHEDIETALTDLCRDHPVSVLCVYDRPGAGVECVDLAVGHHGGGLRESELALRVTEDTVRFRGEIDLTNLDVVDNALRAVAASRPPRLCLELDEATFLSAGAAQLLLGHVEAMRATGARVEITGTGPHVGRVLRLVDSRRSSTVLPSRPS